MTSIFFFEIYWPLAIVLTTHQPQPWPHRGEFLRKGFQVSKWGMKYYIALPIWLPLVANFLPFGYRGYSECQICLMTRSASKCLKSGTYLLFDKTEKLNINFHYNLLFRPRPVRPSPTKQRAATPCPARPSPYKQRTATPCPSRPCTARPRSNMAARLRATLD